MKLTMRIPSFQFEISIEADNPKLMLDVAMGTLTLLAKKFRKH